MAIRRRSGIGTIITRSRIPFRERRRTCTGMAGDDWESYRFPARLAAASYVRVGKCARFRSARRECRTWRRLARWPELSRVPASPPTEE